MRLISHGLLILTAIIWGTTFVFQTTGMETLGPLGFTAARFLVGAIALLPIALFEARRVSLISQFSAVDGKTVLIGVFGLGLLMATGSILQQISLGHTSVANAAFLTTLYVPLVPIFGLMLFRRNISVIRWGAVAVFIIGSGMMTGVSPDEAVFGDIIVAIGALFWAGHIMVVGWLARLTDAPFQLAFCQTAMTAVFAFLFILPSSETISLAAITPALPELLFAGVLSTGLGFGLQLVAQRYASNTASAIMLSLEGVFAAIAGWLMLGQSMAGLAIAGATLIFTAVLIIELTPERNAS
jgi:drug/metabolite transporter (DMT)-like permease